MSKPTHKPGEKAPESGIYDVVGPRGGDRGHQVTVVEDEPFPPTQESGERYVLAKKTKHKS